MNNETKSFSDNYKRLQEISALLQKGETNDVDVIVSLVQEAANLHQEMKPKIDNALKIISDLKGKIEQPE